MLAARTFKRRVRDLLRERRVGEREVGEIGLGHVTPPREPVTVVLDDRRHGAGLVDGDGDGDEDTGEKASVELPRGAVDVERAVAANAAPRPRGQRGRA